MAENFFLYYEELDWCERIKKAGFEIWMNTNACIYHKESISVGQRSALKEYFMNRNRILFERKNASVYERWLFYIYFILIVTPRNILFYIEQREAQFIPVLLKAIWWNVTNKKNSNYLGYP
jgi:GT2 family glycosyltransferase